MDETTNMVKAIERIKAECHDRDCEGNGIRLDKIIQEFLVEEGFGELVEAMNDVECWRA